MSRSAKGCDDSFDLETRAMLQLSLIRGLGPALMNRLILRFGTAIEVLAATERRLVQVPGMRRELVGRIQASGRQQDVLVELQLCREHRVGLVTHQAACYPQILSEIHDPPPILYCRGNFQKSDAVAVAIVGTRRPSRYGVQQAKRLATQLAQAGITVVSGLARGIDAAAHRATIQAGGRTLAVVAGGLLQIYPSEHRQLANDVAAGGVLTSEVALNCKPRRGSFPRRNRIISGLTLGVIVIEAQTRSGALITAAHALDQGREVFAVPGRVDTATSHGCHQLLRDGARLVESVEDVLEELAPWVNPPPCPNHGSIQRIRELKLNEQESAVLGAIDDEATRIEQIVLRTRLPVHRILSTLSVLEMRHLIARLSGDVVTRK